MTLREALDTLGVLARNNPAYLDRPISIGNGPGSFKEVQTIDIWFTEQTTFISELPTIKPEVMAETGR